MKLSGRNTVILGAGRGIGRAIALAFASEGAHLALGARTESEIQAVARECQERKATVVWRKTDVTQPGSVEELARAARQASGPVHTLAYCAGEYGPIGPVAEMDAQALAAWVGSMQVNLYGFLYACRSVLPDMIGHRAGKIIALSGGGATTPLPRLSAYAASKTAVVRLVESLAEELREHNIQVNSIAPGLVDTKLQDAVLQAGEKAGELYGRIRKLRESGAGGISPERAAELAVFLASSDSDGLTGKLISAPHDPWKNWAGQGEPLSRSALYTLRRLDPHTLRPLLDQLK